MWVMRGIDTLLQDVRYAVRLLRRAPGFAAVAVLSLSLGIGAAAVVFNVVDTVLFRPLDVRDPGSLRSFRAELGIGAGARKVVSGADAAVIDVMRRAADFADLIAFRTIDDVEFSVAGSEARSLRAELVSPEYFAVLGTAAATGRLLAPEDRGPSPVPVVVSERVWRVHFNADPAVVGRAAVVNRTPAVIVGVARTFRGLVAERPADIFAPLDATAVVDPTAAATMARLAMRLHPSVPLPEAEAKMAALYQNLGPGMAKGPELRVFLPDASRGVSDVRDDLRRPMVLALVLVAVLMMVACANTGGLLVARFAARRTEFGVRLAIGAGRARLLGQLIVEALLLAAAAGTAALLITRAAGPALAAMVPGDTKSLAFDVRFDWRIVLFTLGTSLAAAAGAAAMSLRQLLRTDTSSVLNAGSRAVARGRRASLEFLVASQIACSLLLLIVALGMGRTLINLRHADPGFQPGGAIAVTVNASARNAAPSDLPPYFAGLYDRLKQLPQVDRLTLAQFSLFTQAMTTGTVDVPSRPAASEDDRWVRLFFVGPDFFETMGMRIIAGTTLGAREMAGRERVAVVTRHFAEFYFGSAQDALGRMVNRDVRIIGVVADARYNSFRDAPARAMFLPFTKAPSRSTMTFVVRPRGDPNQAIAAVTTAIRSHDPILKTTTVPMASLIDASIGRERFAGSMAGVLTMLALILSCAGVYATVAFSVAERRKELAVRLALGATARDIAMLVVRGPVRVAAAGIAVAVPCAYALTRTLSSLLYGVPAFDPAVMLISALALLAIAGLAAAVPAWRTASIDPQECLRAI